MRRAEPIEHVPMAEWLSWPRENAEGQLLLFPQISAGYLGLPTGATFERVDRARNRQFCDCEQCWPDDELAAWALRARMRARERSHDASLPQERDPGPEAISLEQAWA